MTLPVRSGRANSGFISDADFPRVIEIDQERQTNGLPWLHGEVGIDPPQLLMATLRVHNQSGIPIVEGRARIEIGRRRFTVAELRPLGIEAYAHKREAERVEIARRIWSRRAYVTLTFQPAP